METAEVKRNVFRSLLVLHFVGPAMSLGTRLADFAIDRITGGGSLQALSFGRELTGQLAFGLVLPESMMTNDPYFVGGAIASYRITAWEVHGANPTLLRVSK